MSAAGPANQAFCASEARARDFPFYAASLFVPPGPRRGWLALAAFNAEVAQVRDHVTQALTGEVRLQWWRDALTGEGAGADRAAVRANPVAAEMLRAVQAYDIPVEHLIRLIDAHVFDVYDDPMPDMAALEAHCRDTCAALYALRARVLGASLPDVERLAAHAGIAEGLVEVMLALPRHAARRQMYLPADLLRHHHVVPGKVFMREGGDLLGAALAHLRGEARAQLGQAMALLAEAPPAERPAFLPLALVGKMLDRLETTDPFAPPAPARLATLWTLWRAARAKPFRG